MSVSLGVVIIYSGFTVYFCYTTIAPFFPPELERRGLDPLYNSIVFAVYALSYVVFSVLTKKYFIPSLGRLNTFLMAILLQLVAIVTLGLLPLFENNTAFLTTTVVA